ncbi:MAG: penicillin-binding protein 2 [Pseudomonadota bacterium]
MTDFAAPIRRRLQNRAPPADADAGARRGEQYERRLILVMLAFVLFYCALGTRMGLMALSTPEEPRIGASLAADAVRGTITDREGRLMAANLPAWSLYAHPRDVLDPEGTADKLAAIFEDGDRDEMLALLTDDRRFVWIRRPVTPAEKSAVLDIGEPGLLFGSRDMRVYPAGRTAAHIVGSVNAGEEGVHFAEIRGAGGAERYFDARLSDPGQAGEPLALSIDLTMQRVLGEVLEGERRRLGAIGAAGVLMRVETGEILAMVSLPDFDANSTKGLKRDKRGRSPRFNRAVQGRYELGSVFKPLTAAMAIDRGKATPDTMLATGDPIFFGRQRVRDWHRMPDEMSVTDVIRRSSNVGTARLALRVTTPVFKAYLERMGMFDPLPVELSEAAGTRPLLPPKWSELSTMNIAFGHGIAVSPLHLAAAYATLANEGRRVVPSLRVGGQPDHPEFGEPIFDPRTAAQTLTMMRSVVTNGSGRRADVPGFEIAGKTGTADKPYENRPGYDHSRVIATFASVFPVSDPEYVLLVSMDEPTDRSGAQPSRQASRTAAPSIAASVRRLAPLLGLRPRIEQRGPDLAPGPSSGAPTVRAALDGERG